MNELVLFNCDWVLTFKTNQLITKINQNKSFTFMMSQVRVRVKVRVRVGHCVTSYDSTSSAPDDIR